MKKLQWHAGDDYNKREGTHLIGDADPYKVHVSKTVIRPGREWEWDVCLIRDTQRIDAPESYRTLRDAKAAAVKLITEAQP